MASPRGKNSNPVRTKVCQQRSLKRVS
jgi:hypothetical protein